MGSVSWQGSAYVYEKKMHARTTLRNQYSFLSH